MKPMHYLSPHNSPFTPNTEVKEYAFVKKTSGYSIQALRLGADLLTSSVIEGQVHALFDNAIQIKLEDNRLLTLLNNPELCGMRTINIRTNDWSPLRQQLKVSDKVYLTPEQLEHKNIFINWDSQLIWVCPKISKWIERTPEDQISKQLDFAVTWLKQQTNNKTLDKNIIWEAAYSQFLQILSTLKSSGSELENTVKQAIGLGPGLTPSADDMLCGLLLALYFSAEHSYFSDLSVVVKKNLESTSFASQDSLEQACHGWINAYFAEVVSAFTDDVSPDTLIHKLNKHSQIGHYSGLDILIGFILGLKTIFSDFDPLSSSSLFERLL